MCWYSHFFVPTTSMSYKRCGILAFRGILVFPGNCQYMYNLSVYLHPIAPADCLLVPRPKPPLVHIYNSLCQQALLKKKETNPLTYHLGGASPHTGIGTCVVEPYVATVICTMPHKPRHPTSHFIRQYKHTIACLYWVRFHFWPMVQAPLHCRALNMQPIHRNLDVGP